MLTLFMELFNIKERWERQLLYILAIEILYYIGWQIQSVKLMLKEK